jgi:uncharacterized coiled-coil protein SlyX
VSSAVEIQAAIERVEGAIDDLTAQRTELTLIIASHRRELDRLRKHLAALGTPLSRWVEIPGRGRV